MLASDRDIFSEMIEGNRGREKAGFVHNSMIGRVFLQFIISRYWGYLGRATIIIANSGNSLVVQWLGLSAFIAMAWN